MTVLNDDGESPTKMEPMRVAETSRHWGDLSDLSIELAIQAASFRSSLPDGISTALSDLVRSMNCYYSNLIEGHDTHPVDIERALQNDYSQNPEKRNLQLEAKAHINVQQWIDQGGLKGRAGSAAGISEIHQRFCLQLPDDLLWVTNPQTGERLPVVPGQLRQRTVQVGRHMAVSPGAVPRFLNRFEQAYGQLGRSGTLLSAAAAHHRLLWIHPFLDGNGRVARLMSHAMLLDALDTGGIWSIARGLARNEASYKHHLANCDLPRRNDLDGRGQLSEETLAAFSHFFLETCLDQVKFMQSLVQPEQLRSRILSWTAEEIRQHRLPPKAERILEALLYRGSLPRSDLPAILDTGERQARRIVAALTERETLQSESTRSPLYLAFPAKLAAQWMPGLFPEQ
jgi:Fic family protein